MKRDGVLKGMLNRPQHFREVDMRFRDGVEVFGSLEKFVVSNPAHILILCITLATSYTRHINRIRIDSTLAIDKAPHTHIGLRATTTPS